jgi:hypothetical protein
MADLVVDQLGVRKTADAGRLQPDAALVYSIDTVLTETLGPRTKEVVYDQLAKEYSLVREEFPIHLEEFCAVLEEGLGPAAWLLEKSIAKRLYSTLGCNFTDAPKVGIIEHVALVKEIIDRAKETGPN